MKLDTTIDGERVILERLNPADRDTTMLLRIRPGWPRILQNLASVHTAAADRWAQQ